MALKDDLEKQVSDIFRLSWSERDGTVVPTDESLTLGNDGVNVEATILYADLSDSTQLVDGHTKQFATEIYKAFLRCAARIITSEGGTVTAYDGDRVMAVFLGEAKNSTAARAGLKINWVCKNIVQPAVEKQYSTSYVLRHTVGIDYSKVMAARAGIRGANDLVWIGPAPNYAAKLCTLSHDTPTWITKRVYDQLNTTSKQSEGVDMWQARTWSQQDNLAVYCSTYWWSL